MSSKKDISNWPVESRLSTFNELSDRINQDLYDRYPEDQGYFHERPCLFEESAYLSYSRKVIRGDDWGLEVSLRLGILANVLGQEMRFKVSPAIPRNDARFTRSLFTAIPVTIGFSFWILMNMREWSGVEGTAGLLLTGLAGVAIFGVTLGLVYGLQSLFSDSTKDISATVMQDIEDIDHSYDLSQMLS